MTATDRPDPTAPAPLSEPAPTPRRRGLVIGRVVALVLIAGGLTAAAACTPGADNVAAPAPTTTPATTAAPTPTEPPPYAGPLQAVTVPMPAGAVAAASERKGDADGSLSLAQAASEYDAADQASVTAALKDAEYQRGVFLAWRTGGTLVYVQVYQFRYDREAASWTVSQQRGIEGIATSTAYFDEIKDGRWFVTKASNGRGAAHAFFSKGPFAVMIDTFATGTADLDGTKKLAVAQFGLLP